MKPMYRITTLLALIAMVAFGPDANASADYEYRAKQIKAQLQAAGIVAGAGGPLERAEVYGKERAKALADLVGYLEKCDGKGSCASRWKSRAKPMVTRANDRLKFHTDDLKCYPGGKSSEEIESVRAAILKQEKEFWELIAGSSLPTDLQQTVLVRELLEEKRKELIAKWSVIKRHDERTDREMEDVAKDLEKTNKALEDASKEGGNLTKKLTQGAKTLGEVLAVLYVKSEAKAPPDPGALGTATSAALSLAVHAAETNLIGYCKVVASSKWGRLRKLINSERNLMLLFHDIRGNLKEFIEENGEDRISRLEQAIETAVKKFTSVRNQLGQNLDGVELQKATREIAKDRLDAARAAYEQLVEKEKGRFHGDVSDTTLEELWEAKYWEAIERDVDPREYEVELRKTAEEIGELTKRFEKDIDELSDYGLSFDELHAIVKDLREAKKMLGEIDGLSLSEVLGRFHKERERLLDRVDRD